ncbi:MAG: site-specific integrase [Bacteroidetes bacterium]|jgi:integrase/recombinase XerD|nr:site-specific integrase [Bacteroidota bacterium]
MVNKENRPVRVLFKGNYIILRGRKGERGESLYLEYHIVENGKKLRKYEFLSKLALLKSLSPDKRKENLQFAIEEAQQRDSLLLNGEYDLISKTSLKIDFIQFCENYISKYKKNDLKMIKACVNHFKVFMKLNNITSLQGKDIKENLIFQYKEYLLNDSGLNGESPNSYFRRFKKILRQAQREQLVKGDPAKDITIKVNKNSFTKDVLSIEDLQKLNNTHCTNDQIKRAFLFSAMTGLRFVDVKFIKWKNIDKGVLKYKQEKTDIENSVNLNKTALSLITETGEPESKVFTLPSFEYCMRVLKEWKATAGLNKHITWHVARHSFATNLLIAGTDIKTTAGLLGHADLNHVNRYVRLVEQLKEDAVNNIEL